MRHSIVIVVLLMAWLPVAWADAAEVLDPATEYKLAYEAEKQGDLAAALLHWENLQDSCDITREMRVQVVDRIRELRPQVPVDPKKEPANTWTCLVLVYKHLDFEWTDAEGTKHHVVTTMSDDDIAEVRRGVDGFAGHVLNYTSREMRIAYDFRVIERTLSSLVGGQRFWLGPKEVEKDMDDVPFGAYESVFAYVKMQQEEDGPSVPGAFGGGALGSDIGPKGCGYTNILLWVNRLKPNTRKGEIELHEWLHQIDWMFVALQGYPDEICPNPDGGRKEGDYGGDADFRHTAAMKGLGWMPYYAHMMQDHVTRRMWRNASMHRMPDTRWLRGRVSEWLVLGPFEKTNGTSLATPFIDEETVEPRPGLKTAGKQWRLARNKGVMLELNALFDPNDNVVAYAHVYVHSDKTRLAQLRLGTDDGGAVWHNGRLIYFAPVARGIQNDRNIVDVELTEGWNRFLFKVDDISGSWALTARLTTPRRGPVPGIRLAATPDASPAE